VFRSRWWVAVLWHNPGVGESHPFGAVAARCAGLVKRYGDVAAVAGLDLEVRAGECFGLLGPNGAGKTTTIEILEGLLEPDEGTLEVLGQRWSRGAGGLRQRLGIQLQETRLNERLTVEETVRLFRSFYLRGPAVDQVLGLVELEAKRGSWVGKLSGGQRQRLAVLLFLDEPTTGLDPQSRRQLWALLQRFRSQGGTILITTHYMEEAEALCDRVGIMDHGRLIALGSPRELVASLGASHVVQFALTGDDTIPLEQLRALPGVREVRSQNGTFSLTVSQSHVTIPALLAALGARAAGLSHLATHQATLEDLFVALTGRHLRDD